MSKIGRRTFLKGAALSGAALAGGAAQGLLSVPAIAQAKYPTKPVRMIVPLAPGGGLDFIARLTADVVTREIGQQMVVENRTGAGGTIGIEAVVQSPADGYTLLAINDNIASAPHVQRLPKDYTKDVAPVCLWGLQPQVFAVHPSLKIDTMEEFLEYAKKNPGQGVATSGVGSNQHVLLAWFQQATGLNFTHVPYRGAGQAIGDLVGGQVAIGCLGPTAIMPHYKAGALKVLAQSGSKRISPLPDFPTLEEAGVKGVVLESWYAGFAPAGTPEPIIQQLNAAMNKAMEDETVRKRLFDGAIEPVGGTPDDLGKLYLEDAAKYQKLVNEFGITSK